MHNTTLKVIKFILMCLPVFVFYPVVTHAAHVPTGTKLAKIQALNISVSDNPVTLDAQRIEDTPTARVGLDLFEGLVSTDENGNVIHSLAERHEVSSDGKVYTFFLRKNAKFSDGSPVLASDVVFSYRRLVDPKTASTYSFAANPIKNASLIIEGKKSPTDLGVSALNPTTVQIVLERPIPYFLNLIAMINFGIVKESNVLQFKDAFTQPGNLVSSGAYKLKYWKIGDKVILVKNPHYWDSKNTVVDTVVFLPIVDGNTEIQMYQAGQVDFTFNVPADKVKKLKATIPNELKIAPYLGIYYFDLNMKKEPFKNNPKLRQALSMAIDRDVLTHDVLGRGESSAYDLIPNGTVNYTQQKYEWASWSYEKRVQKAQELFKESGYSETNPLKITVSYNTDIGHKKVTLAVASMWQKVFGKNGLKVALENQEWKVFLRTRQQGDFQIARDGWIADYNDASSFANLLYSTNPQNNSHYNNPMYDQIQNSANAEQDLKKRQELFEKGMQLALSEYPIIPLYNYVAIHLVKPYVGGYTLHDSLDHTHTRNLYVVEH